MYDKQKIIDWALAQVGYHELPGNHNKYSQYLDGIPGFYNGKKDGFSWCDCFVDAGFCQCYGVLGAKELLCQPDNSCGAGCLYSANYFKQHGRFHEHNPQTGDQIFFTYSDGEVSHTGLVVDVTSYSVVTVEGNTSDMVAKRSYPLSDARIFGYGRPDWGAEAKEDDATADVPAHKSTIGGLPLLKVGSRGEVVRAAQFLLNGRDANVGKWGADGDFGQGTRAAVLAFQRRNGLEADGIIGVETWSKLLGVN